MDVPVFFIKLTNRSKRSLRRFAYSPDRTCSAAGSFGFCDATVFLDYSDSDEASVSRSWKKEAALEFSQTGWPAACSACGVPFADGDQWQLFCERVYEDASGREFFLRNLPVGACYDADWRGGRKGFDGRCLYVMTPGGLWGIDERASNCTMPTDKEHRCWVRHGSPEEGTLHVDKDGLTCQAGAGSIQAGTYHGFLHHGKLTGCPG